MSQVTVARISEIPVNSSRVVHVRGRDIAIFNVDGQWFAIDDLCPHMGASLSGGFVEDGCVTCPWHYWRFRLTDGAWADNPKVRIGSYPVTIHGDSVLLTVPESWDTPG
ncbi:MAG: nitrite reductase small subunit NirD [Gemmataceae bacterium]|nr:nitrite reductase small subunit NirD [Gemmata sp.]MDW8198956.1 nitrite reductase small subunit NirD [Gemmataceae bacterium]